jgi:hypothetical protein
MTHQEQFKQFMLAIQDLDYVIFRGFRLLPDLPDTDVDLVVVPEQFEELQTIAAKYLYAGKCTNYGYAEWCDMQYHPHFTTAPKDPRIPNKHQAFRIDLHNSLYFRTPLEDSFWTVGKRYFDSVIHRRRYENFYYLISPEDEIALTVCRGALDHKGEWKEKHKQQIHTLLNTVPRELAVKTIAEVLPNAEDVYVKLEQKKYEEIKWD